MEAGTENDEKECTIILSPGTLPFRWEVNKAFEKEYPDAEIISWVRIAGTVDKVKIKYRKKREKSNKVKSNDDKGCVIVAIIILGYIALVATIIIASFIFIFTVNLWWTKILMILLFVTNIIVGVFVIPIKVIIGIVNTDVDE